MTGRACLNRAPWAVRLVAIFFLVPGSFDVAWAGSGAGSGDDDHLTQDERAALCERLWLTQHYVWSKYGTCFTDARALAVFGMENCFRSRRDALMSMSGPDHARLETMKERYTELQCGSD